jgi:hypothetical protein
MVAYTWSTSDTQVITVTAQGPEGSVTDTHTIAVVVPVESVHIDGPTVGAVDTVYTFTAAVSPVTATRPITYAWDPAPVGGQGTATATFAWSMTGTEVISVAVAGVKGTATDTHAIAIATEVPVESVAIDGPVTGTVGTIYAFTALISPATATPPITYTWSPAPSGGQGTAAVTYAWPTAGAKVLRVTVESVGGTVSDTHTITLVVPVESVAIDGPVTGTVGLTYTFTAIVSPITATPPVSCVWVPAPDAGQGTATVTYTWPVTGTMIISVTVRNAGGAAVDWHAIAVGRGMLGVYLPLVLRDWIMP